MMNRQQQQKKNQKADVNLKTVSAEAMDSKLFTLRTNISRRPPRLNTGSF